MLSLACKRMSMSTIYTVNFIQKELTIFSKNKFCHLYGTQINKYVYYTYATLRASKYKCYL